MMADACNMGKGCKSFDLANVAGASCLYRKVSTAIAVDGISRCYYVRNRSGACGGVSAVSIRGKASHGVSTGRAREAGRLIGPPLGTPSPAEHALDWLM
jgi:hypothetical protein